MDWKIEPIQVWHLERHQPLSTQSLPRSYDLQRLKNTDPSFCRYLYATVDAPWRWYEKLGWSLEEWRNHVTRDDTFFWVAYQEGCPIGYFEIKQESTLSAEICLFGLMPAQIGTGLGGLFLQDAIHAAFGLATDRIWLHTCSLDHPNALANYQKHGFTIFKEESFKANIPQQPLEPFVGAFER